METHGHLKADWYIGQNPVAMELFPRVQAEKLEHFYIYFRISHIYIFKTAKRVNCVNV